MEEWLKALPEGVLVELKYEEGPNEFVLRTGFGWSLFGYEEIFSEAQLISDGVVDGSVVRYRSGSRDEAVRIEEAEFEAQSKKVMEIFVRSKTKEGATIGLVSYDGTEVSGRFLAEEIRTLLKELDRYRVNVLYPGGMF